MQTLGLTMATAAPDVGAESAVQPNAAASSGAGAIFEILMTAAGEPIPNGLTPNNSALPTETLTLAPSNVSALDPATQALANDLASDVEQMVQALAITAEVVAQGMALRTTPVREIILTVETPKTDISAQTNLPQLSILVPTQVEPGPSLTVTDADPAKNLDPALIAMMPMPPTATTPAMQGDETPQMSSELINALPRPVDSAETLSEIPAPQASSSAIEEAYGPWRAEIHGPILNAQRELLTQPVHVSIFEAPEPVAIQVPVSEAFPPQVIVTPRPNETPVAHQDATADMTIRVVTIQVSMKAKAPSDAHDLDATETNLSATHSEPTDNAPTDKIQPPPVITAPLDFIGPQMIPLIVSDPQSTTATQIDQETLPDAPDAHAPAQPDSHVLLFKAAQAAVTNVQNTKQAPAPVLAQQTVMTPGVLAETPAFDVSAVVEALHRDADLSRVAHRQAEDMRNYASLLDTKITNPVAKTSSTRNEDIRNLMKSGVRDIEIIHGQGSTQDMNVTPQVQTTEPTGASAATRAQVATSFAPSGNEANTSERRAQAHEIRMRAIERQVVAAVRDGADTIRMQLYPPGLGQIIIRLTMDGSKLKLTTSANSSDAADSLRSIEGDLRDALSVGGLELTGFDVSEDGDGGQKNRKNASEAENRNQQSRSVKSDDFALDMNA